MSEYTGYELGGFDADLTNTFTSFEHKRKVSIKTPNTTNAPNVEQVMDTDTTDTGSKSDLPIDKVRTLLKGTEKVFEYTEPAYVDTIPEELTDKANMIEHPDTLTDHPTLKQVQSNEELGMNSFIDEGEKKLEINFHGFDGRAGEWKEMVFKNIPDPLKDAVKLFRRTDQFYYARFEIESLIEKYPDYKLVFNGHSWGGFQSRFWASEYNAVSHNFNAHVMPWNRFKRGGQHYFHTTITDPTDFKHVFPMKRANENHFYYPANKVVKEEILPQKVLSGHYIKNFANPTEASTVSKFAKVLNKTGILHTIGLGLTVKDTFDAVKNDVNQEGVTTAQKVSDSTVDVANKAQEFVVGNALFDGIFASTVALAPETGGISLVAGGLALGGVVAYTAVSEKVAPVVKKEVVKGANAAKKEIVNDVNKVAKGFKSAGKSIKHFFHW